MRTRISRLQTLRDPKQGMGGWSRGGINGSISRCRRARRGGRLAPRPAIHDRLISSRARHAPYDPRVVVGLHPKRVNPVRVFLYGPAYGIDGRDFSPSLAGRAFVGGLAEPLAACGSSCCTFPTCYRRLQRAREEVNKAHPVSTPSAPASLPLTRVHRRRSHKHRWTHSHTDTEVHEQTQMRCRQGGGGPWLRRREERR